MGRAARFKEGRQEADQEDMRTLMPLVVALMLLGGCAATGDTQEPVQEPALSEEELAEQAYLDAVTEFDPDLDPQDALKIGWHLCRELSRGALEESEAMVWLILEYPDDVSTDIPVFAPKLLCPDWYKP